MIKKDYSKSGKQQRKQDRKRVDAELRNEAYQKLPLSEKKKINPKKFLNK